MNNMNDKNFDLVMPAAKKLILENDIDANIMQGTGKDGRITKGDVLLFLKSNGSLQKTTNKVHVFHFRYKFHHYSSFAINSIIYSIFCINLFIFVFSL